MSKKNHSFRCANCGAEYGKWHGRCAACDEWNSVMPVEGKKDHAATASVAQLQTLSSISGESIQRELTGIGEFDLVCGGGMIPGSVILLGGEPGIGKSTLALHISHALGSLYISGEESPVQIRHRADRLGCDTERIRISTATDIEEIIALMRQDRARCVIIDSIQTLHSSDVPGPRGSVSQIRESAMRLADAARETGSPVILIGHITKDGAIAGPKLLEHLVDTVLYFEGNYTRDIRILRAFKNRYGSVNEIGLFRMGEAGLVEIKDKNRVFNEAYHSISAGNAVSAALEGSRIILFEVQSLVTRASSQNPRRMSDGFDVNRLILLTAVLEKHAGLNLSAFDVFVNVSGGFQIQEPAADLAVAVAIASSLKNRPVPEGIAFLGELSLSGEVRAVSHCARRVQECRYAGYSRIVLPRMQADECASAAGDTDVNGVSTISQALGFFE